MDQQTYLKEITKAVSFFWKSKQKQLATSVDKSNRGAVVGGKQMDGFISLLKKVAENSGVPRSCIYTKNNYLPGFFRSSKNWDFLVISPSKKLIAAIELKSQIGSYGNNFNNRTEEAIGSAVDLWTAYRENQFPNQQAPWVGYIMVVGKDIGSTTPVKNNELIKTIEIFEKDTVRPLLVNGGIVVAFAIVFIIVTNLVSKKKQIIAYTV